MEALALVEREEVAQASREAFAIDRAPSPDHGDRRCGHASLHRANLHRNQRWMMWEEW